MLSPLLAVVALVAIALAAAAPLIVYDALAGHLGSRIALYWSLAVGAAVLIGLAAAWVLLRSRRT